jgi:hypothetical protein
MNNAAMLKMLRETDFPKNKGRTNILNKGQTHSLSMVLGKVRKLYTKKELSKVPSRHNEKYPELLKAGKALLKAHDPKYRFEAMTVNKNQKAASHTDVNNVGTSYIIGMGNYTGGQLIFTDKDSPYYGSHNIKNKWLKFVGDTPHHVAPFTGERYSLVFYHWK